MPPTLLARADEVIDRAAVARWPAARITLRQGIRVVHDIKKGVRHAEATIETNRPPSH